MEYILNKVEPAVRQQVNDKTKEGKVHSKNGIAINKDKHQEEEAKDKENQRRNLKNQELKRYDKNKRIIIDAVKVDTVSIDAMNEEEKIKNKKGLFIDIRK